MFVYLVILDVVADIYRYSCYILSNNRNLMVVNLFL